MGSLKRKEGPGGTTSTAKAARPATESRPSKRPKPSDASNEKEDSKAGAKGPKDGKPQKQKPSKDAAAAAPTVTLLKEEEPLFPRGGGSVLTPLEQKEIQIQAKRDALFEEHAGANGKGGKDGKSKKKRRKSEVETQPAHDPDAVKIESLNFKVSRPTPRFLHS